MLAAQPFRNLFVELRGRREVGKNGYCRPALHNNNGRDDLNAKRAHEVSVLVYVDVLEMYTLGRLLLECTKLRAQQLPNWGPVSPGGNK